ncbi:hypothetical protein CERSUDRAFT_98883 [Gelatoporia subvermispora B]|uniref:Uncharacterized protein n=1 Tax=Ceriporiopsis subvermispora (strain B) TaxID=914234 RepID=M2PBD7_CERS8|nr:hypothetical protein CERSUDRAFT_98883 [Gelatoporia subvermispora B]
MLGVAGKPDLTCGAWARRPLPVSSPLIRDELIRVRASFRLGQHRARLPERNPSLVVVVASTHPPLPRYAFSLRTSFLVYGLFLLVPTRLDCDTRF